MSLTIRFPKGKTIVYNSATHLIRDTNEWNLYSKKPEKGGHWIASIQSSAGVIVEAVAPCNVSSPVDLKEAIKQVNSALEGHSLNGEGLLLKKTKRLLKRFNSYTCKIK